MANGKTYYECHITLELPAKYKSDALLLKEVIEFRRWRYSQIDGDIVEGAGVKAYATRHYNSSNSIADVLGELNALANWLQYLGFTVTRRKIEHVIFDTKSAQVCPTDCLECIRD